MARAMLLAAEIYTADRMFATGFLTRTTADTDVYAQSHALATRIAALAPAAARRNKQTLRSQVFMPDTQTYAYADSPEHREGIEAFLNKRKPEF